MNLNVMKDTTGIKLITSNLIETDLILCYAD